MTALPVLIAVLYETVIVYFFSTPRLPEYLLKPFVILASIAMLIQLFGRKYL